MNENMIIRNQRFQCQPSWETMRQDREMYSVNIRKEKRIRHNEIKRRFNTATNQPMFDSSWLTKELTDHSPSLLKPSIEAVEKFKLVFELFLSPIISLAIPASRAALEYLKNNDLRFLDEFLNEDICTRLLNNLKSSSESLVLNTLRVIIEFYSGVVNSVLYFTYTELLQSLLKLLDHQMPEIVRESLVAIHNYIFEHSISTESSVIFIEKNLRIMKDSIFEPDLPWVAANFTLIPKKALPKFAIHSMFSQIISLLACNQSEVIINALKSLFYITTDHPYLLDLTIPSAPRIISLLDNPEVPIQFFSLKLVGNFISGSEVQTQALIDLDIIRILLKKCKDPNASIRNEAVFSVGNLLVGDENQIEAVMNTPGFDLKRVLHDDSGKVRQEALWWVANIMSSGNERLIFTLVDIGTLVWLIHALVKENRDVCRAFLTQIINVLEMVRELRYDRLHDIVAKLDETECIEILHDLELEDSKNDELIHKIFHLLEIVEVDDGKVGLNRPVEFVFS